jgi:hypothetical protein
MEVYTENKIMLKFILIASIGILTSCATCKERKLEKEAEKATVEETVKENPNVMSSERPMREEDMIDIEGTVRINKDGCPVLIEMVEGDLYSVAYPVNLEDEFKVDGLVIKFAFLPSKADGCKAERVISLTEVSLK